MPFVWFVERPAGGLAFKENGSFTEKRQADAQVFATKEDAADALEKARKALFAKKEAHKQKTGAKDADGSAKGRVFGSQPTFERHDSVLLKLNIKLNRLERTSLMEIQEASPQLKTLWAVVAEDGQWLEVRSGMCALTRKPDEATFFESEEQAREMAREGEWTRAAAELANTANVVELDVRIKTAKPVFSASRGSSGVNAFAGAWMAEQERDDLAAEIQTQKTAPNPKSRSSGMKISGNSGKGVAAATKETDAADKADKAEPNAKKPSRRI